jgi:hypothetical protein
MIGSNANDCSDANTDPVIAFDATIAPVARASFLSTTFGGCMLAVYAAR